MAEDHGPRRSTDVLAGFAPPVTASAAAQASARARGGTGADGVGTCRPVEPRRSASVVLMRDAPVGAAGIEVYLLHRHDRMPFAPSVAVFPGGGLDPVDTASADPVLACAVRETQEETTVRLDPATLLPWARWVTPVHEPRRYDTTFYLAVLPDGQEARDVSGETERAGWTPAAEALTAREAGELSLMPPTWSILLEVAAAPDVAALLAGGRDRRVETVLPRLVRRNESWVFVYEVLR